MSNPNHPDHIEDAATPQPAPLPNAACRESGCTGAPCGNDGSPDACGHYKRPASTSVEIRSIVTCNKCKRAWLSYAGCMTEPLPCGHMRSQWAVAECVVDDMAQACAARNKPVEDIDDDDEE